MYGLILQDIYSCYKHAILSVIGLEIARYVLSRSASQYECTLLRESVVLES